MLSSKDIDKLKAKGIGVNEFERQLGFFKKGFPPVCLSRAATAGDGILSFDETERKFLTNIFKHVSADLRIIKFVPASGAATRMFKPLFEFIQEVDDASVVDIEQINERGFNAVYLFFRHLEKFAFTSDLENIFINEGKDLWTLRKNGDFMTILDRLLFEKGLNYSMLPKALLKFHRYPDGSRVAVEEHLVEAANYTRDANNMATLHFTLSPEHLHKFNEIIECTREKYEKEFSVRFNVTYSVQKPSTDTVAVDLDNIPLRNDDGTLLFRPAGHGALIENLNEINADLIFIKNIDNVVPDAFKESTFEYKKLLGGYMFIIRDHIFKWLRKIELNDINEEEIGKMVEFAKDQLLICLPSEFDLFTPEKKLSILKEKFNRPIRVCGMVKNEGEPGGGPFWVKDTKGDDSLQIVESSQINMNDEEQKKIFDSASYFNPVDIVCSIKDWQGNTFNLSDYVDESTGFISIKSSGGKNLKALELPGLWNGAMANWVTVFIEVPLITFNPVKIINDLLRKEHQS